MSETEMSRAAFVRTQPLTLSVAEVIAKGKARGIEVKPSDVHAARWTMKAKRAAANGGGVGVGDDKRSGAVSVSAKRAKPARGDGMAFEFRKLALRMGLVRARAELAALDTLDVEIH